MSGGVFAFLGALLGSGISFLGTLRSTSRQIEREERHVKRQTYARFIFCVTSFLDVMDEDKRLRKQTERIGADIRSRWLALIADRPEAHDNVDELGREVSGVSEATDALENKPQSELRTLWGIYTELMLCAPYPVQCQARRVFKAALEESDDTRNADDAEDDVEKDGEDREFHDALREFGIEAQVDVAPAGRRSRRRARKRAMEGIS